MLFAKKNHEPAPDDLAQENWKANFGLLGKKRFTLENTADYRSSQEKGKLTLSLKRTNLFAWALDSYYKYADFLLEGEVEFEPEAPYGAAGFLFRYVNDENFYYFLISNKGYFRFDLVFNGTPMPFINWTFSPIIHKSKNEVMILAHGSHFSFFIDDEWVGELNDDTLPEGKIGFTAQNFEIAAPLDVHLNQFSLESRPLEVEKAAARWNGVIPIDPEHRILLAKTFFSMGNFTCAAIQIKKVFKQKKASVDELLFFSETLINLRVYDVALEYIEQALKLKPTHPEALQEKANLLYLQNRFLDTRDFLRQILPGFEENATLWNLMGNAEYALGNWEAAASAYETASRIDGTNPLFLMNEARARERNKQQEVALKKYLEASYTLFHQEGYGDLYNILPRVIALEPDNKQVRAFQAKMLFHENKTAEAATIIDQLIDEGYKESAIYYLAGLLKTATGAWPEAIALLENACALEPDFYLNWYKLAESRYFVGQQPGEALEKATNLQPEYPWTINLTGLLCLKAGNTHGAMEHFRHALQLAPDQLDILLNLSEALSLAGEKEESFSVLAQSELADDPRLLNHRGNLYTRDKAYEMALREYEKALRLDPDNLTFMENLAGVCIELDMIMRAEELLLKLYDQNPTATILSLVGNLADIKGEFKRAEVAYTEALKIKPDDLNLQCHLAAVYLNKKDYQESKRILKQLSEANPTSCEVARLCERMHKQFEESHRCSTCERVWWVPRELPLQTQLKLVGQPPAEAPAGQCPTCDKVYCIACRQDSLRDDRFTCPTCGEFLKLPADWLKYLLRETMTTDSKTNND